MEKSKLKRFLVFCVICGTLVMHGYAADTLRYRGTISTKYMYSRSTGKQMILQGTAVPSSVGYGYIRIYADYIRSENTVYNNALLYEIRLKFNGTTNWEWDLPKPTGYDVYSGELGVMGEFYHAYSMNHPPSGQPSGPLISKKWLSDAIQQSVIGAHRCYLEYEYNLSKLKEKRAMEKFSSVPVRYELILPSGVSLTTAHLPGIGMFYENGEVSKSLRFNPSHEFGKTDPYNHDWSDEIYYDLKNPLIGANVIDLKLASHRGFWGYDLGNGPIENTEPSIVAAKQYTSVIESDVSMTEDGVVVVSHDYNLQRLTDYNIPIYEGRSPVNTFIRVNVN